MVIYAKLAVSMAVQAILGAIPAALAHFWQYYCYKTDFIYFEKEIETIRELILLIPYITFF